jgi:hypothetical protein
LDKDGKADESRVYNAETPVTVESVKKSMETHPGCRMHGSFNVVMKVKSSLFFTFQDNFGVYYSLKSSGGPSSSLNLEFNIEHLTFGNTDKNKQILDTLLPYHEDIHSELNPIADDKPHRNGLFSAYHYVQVFPFEVINELTNENFHSHQYSFVKNYKPMDANNGESPAIFFQMDFLPMISVYHIKTIPKFTTLSLIFSELVVECSQSSEYST